jgi:hypothetical protein
MGNDNIQHTAEVSGQRGYEADTFGAPTAFGSPPQLHQLVNGSFHDAFDVSIPLDTSLSPHVSDLQKWTMNLRMDAEAVAHNGGEAFSDVLDTLSVGGITFYDPAGNVIPGLGVMDDAGVLYPVVPEPPSLLLAVVAAAMLLLGRRFHRSTAS